MSNNTEPEPLPQDEALRRFLIFVASRDWNAEDTRVPIREAFTYAAGIDLEKRVAVYWLGHWLHHNTEIYADPARLNGLANRPYYLVVQRRRNE